MKILVCDRCGFELTEKDDITLVVEGSESWLTTARGRGQEPRGVYPCKNYIRCSGEMIFREKKKKRLFQK
jgi:hypothetical protein